LFSFSFVDKLGLIYPLLVIFFVTGSAHWGDSCLAFGKQVAAFGEEK
jgi:hypothetical protein